MTRVSARGQAPYLRGAALGALGCVLACSACSSGAESTEANDDAGMSMDGLVSCASDPLATVYAPGLERTSTTGAFRVRFVSATPAPPALGTNRWVVAITDDKGAPVVDAKFPPRSEWGTWPNGVRLFMPYHGHTASVAPDITAHGDGTYSIDDAELSMPGLWQISFHIERTVTDDVTFGFCVAG
jgi:hypothetical protein